jgi:hypothetical protein
MENQTRRKVFFAVGLLWGLAGCASVGVRNPAQATGNPKMPKQIFVVDFDTSKGAFRVNRSGDQLVTLQEKTANVLADYLVSDLSKSVIPATRQDGSRHSRADAWLITGEFVRVNEGSRALRGLVGLGAGGTKMETVVRVYDLSHLSKEPILQFETSAVATLNRAQLLADCLGLCQMRDGMREQGGSPMIPRGPREKSRPWSLTIMLRMAASCRVAA